MHTCIKMRLVCWNPTAILQQVQICSSYICSINNIQGLRVSSLTPSRVVFLHMLVSHRVSIMQPPGHCKVCSHDHSIENVVQSVSFQHTHEGALVRMHETYVHPGRPCDSFNQLAKKLITRLYYSYFACKNSRHKTSTTESPTSIMQTILKPKV